MIPFTFNNKSLTTLIALTSCLFAFLFIFEAFRVAKRITTIQETIRQSHLLKNEALAQAINETLHDTDTTTDELKQTVDLIKSPLIDSLTIHDDKGNSIVEFV